LIGRFVSRSPLEELAPLLGRGGWVSWPQYLYSRNDPVNVSDASGLQTSASTGECALKQAFYNLVRSLFVTDEVWQPLLDNWFNETGPNPASFDGSDDPHNQQIANNVGFKKLLECWFAARNAGLGVVPKGRWSVTNAGFTWNYTLNPKEAAGGIFAFGPMTNFLGSYTAAVTVLCDDNPICDVRIEVKNTTSWQSATGIPGRFAPFLAKLGIINTDGRASVWPSHKRGAGPCTPSTGGDFAQVFTFDLKGVACGGETCDLT
jgi:hypothetical protein